MAPHPQAGCPPCQELGAKLNEATLGAIEAENRHDAAQASLFHQQAATYSRELGECMKTCWSGNVPESGKLVAPVAPGPTVPGAR